MIQHFHFLQLSLVLSVVLSPIYFNTSSQFLPFYNLFADLQYAHVLLPQDSQCRVMQMYLCVCMCACSAAVRYRLRFMAVGLLLHCHDRARLWKTSSPLLFWQSPFSQPEDSCSQALFHYLSRRERYAFNLREWILLQLSQLRALVLLHSQHVCS